jgi:hypothetical protein
MGAAELPITELDDRISGKLERLVWLDPEPSSGETRRCGLFSRAVKDWGIWNL